MNKCKDCRWLAGKRTSIGIECLNPHLQRKWSGDYYRKRATCYKAPSAPACKVYFEPKAVAMDHALWVWDDDAENFRCSACGTIVRSPLNIVLGEWTFCPHCGMKLEKGERKNE